MSSTKQYRPWAPTQPFLLPPSPLEWLPEGHLAYFLLEVVAELDLSEIESTIQEKDARGVRPYDPAMMVALLLYGYCVGVFSSRKLERATYEDVAFRVLSGGQHPHFTRIAAFRRDHLEALRGFFLQVLKLCQRMELVKLGHVAIDGTKIQGNASKHKAMSYERMLEAELKLEEEIDSLLARADEIDASEDARYGEGCREEDLPAELRQRKKRLEKIRRAKADLEREATQARARHLREQAARAQKRAEQHENPTVRKRVSTFAKNRLAEATELDPERDDDDIDPPSTTDGLVQHEPKTKTDGTPHDKAQMNFTDPDSRIMGVGGKFQQGYNCQAAVDEAHQIIVAEAVTNKASDNENLPTMVRRVKENCGEVPVKTTADSGYWDPAAPKACNDLGTDVYISTSRESFRPERPSPAEPGGDNAVPRAGPPELADERQRMRDKLRSEEGRRSYARRKAVVEPAFGQMKEARGFRRFHLRGLRKVQAEWSLVCTGHNLLKLFRFRRAAVA